MPMTFSNILNLFKLFQTKNLFKLILFTTNTYLIVCTGEYLNTLNNEELVKENFSFQKINIK